MECIVFLMRETLQFIYVSCVLQGYPIEGTTLVVRYPDRIHTRLGVSRDASTESGKIE